MRIVLFILGVIVVLSGLGAVFYKQTVRPSGRTRLGEPEESYSQRPFALLGALGVIVGLALMVLSSLFIVRATEVAVPVKLGTPGEPLSNGLKFRAPWSKLSRFETRVQDTEIEVGTTGSDGGALKLNTRVRYSIKLGLEGTETTPGCSVADLFRSVRNEDALEARIVRGGTEQVVRDAFRQFPGFAAYTTAQPQARQIVLDELRPYFAKNCVELVDFLILNAEADPSVASAAASAQAAALRTVEASEAARKLEIDTKSSNAKRVSDAETDRKVANEKADGQVEVARKQAEANETLAKSLTPEVLMAQYIDAIEKSANRIIITDGSLPQLTLPVEGAQG